MVGTVWSISWLREVSLIYISLFHLPQYHVPLLYNHTVITMLFYIHLCSYLLNLSLLTKPYVYWGRHLFHSLVQILELFSISNSKEYAPRYKTMILWFSRIMKYYSILYLFILIFFHYGGTPILLPCIVLSPGGTGMEWQKMSPSHGASSQE